jgi:hypothetical protein
MLVAVSNMTLTVTWLPRFPSSIFSCKRWRQSNSASTVIWPRFVRTRNIVSVFDKEKDIFSLRVVRSALRSTHQPIQWIQRGLSLGIKRPESTANHCRLGRFELKNKWSYASVPSRYVQTVHIQQLTSSDSVNNSKIHFKRTGLNVDSKW